MFHPVSVDCDPKEDVDPAVTHPSVIGYSFTEKPPKTPPPPPPPIPSKEECMLWFLSHCTGIQHICLKLSPLDHQEQNYYRAPVYYI